MLFKVSLNSNCVSKSYLFYCHDNFYERATKSIPKVKENNMRERRTKNCISSYSKYV